MVITIIPAYNEEKTIGEVLDKVKNLTDKVIVINDGSTDKTAEITKQYNVEILNHILNRGLGAALRTGFSAALKENAEIIVTLDADGQHNPEDIPRLLAPIQNNEVDVVIGSRFIRERQNQCHSERSEESHRKPTLSWLTHEISAGRPRFIGDSCEILPPTFRRGQDDIPTFRKFANFFGNIITFLFFGIWVTDSQSGFRAFSREALQKLNLKSSGMAVSSEIIKEIKRNHLRLKEIPIKPVYTRYSMSKGQNMFEGIKTVYHLILRKMD